MYDEQGWMASIGSRTSEAREVYFPLYFPIILGNRYADRIQFLTSAAIGDSFEEREK